MENVPVRRISLLTLLGAMASFLLPFATFSCQHQPIVTLSGRELLTGTTIEREEPFGGKKQEKVPLEPLAVVAFGCALFGVGAALSRKRESVFAGVLAGASAVALFLLKSKIEGDVARQGSGLIGVEFRGGFWLALVFAVGTALVNGLPLLLRGKVKESGTEAPAPGS